MNLVLVLSFLIPTAQARIYAPLILQESKRQNTDPLLVAAIIHHESRFNANLCFRGAIGLMQLQTETRKCIKRYVTPEDHPYADPRTNIRQGIWLMKMWREYCRRSDHEHHWLLHYNQGFGYCKNKGCRVREDGHLGGYPDRVLEIYRFLKAKANDHTT